MTQHRPHPILLFLNSLLCLLLIAVSPLTGSAPLLPAVQADAPGKHLWVDALHGHDQNHGLAQSSALRTIQQAADLAGPGTTVHVLPGVYRETVRPAQSGSATAPIVYLAEGGVGTAAIRGSEPSSSLRWTRLSGNTIGLPPGVDPARIYYADLSPWALSDAPRFVVQLDGRGEPLRRLPMAREPDWQVVRDWKGHEFWWAADGGQSIAPCDPATDPDYLCDRASWSTTQLIDRTNDAGPAGIQAGNLTTLRDLAGATLVVLDAREGEWGCRSTIAGHDASAGRVTLQTPCTWWGPNPLGWGSKYYVEGRPSLLDTPGEWWYDAASGRLYLWPPQDGDPATMNLEISRRDDGLVLRNRSYTTWDGLTIEYWNGYAVNHTNYERDRSYNNTIRNATLRYANRGLRLHHAVSADQPAANVTDGFTLENSQIAHMDTQGIEISSWWDDNAHADAFVRSPVRNTLIRGNEIHHVGFRSDSGQGIGAILRAVDRLRFEDNHVHHTAHHGLQFYKSVIQSPRAYGFVPDEIKTGEILVKDNLFERTCQLTTECSGVKVYGDPPDGHVFRDFLITGNVFRDIYGWAYASEKRGIWTPSAGSEVRGMGGIGLDVDTASGVHIYRNIAYNTAYIGFRFAGPWRDGDILLYNNVAANSVRGVELGGGGYDTHPSVNTQVANNILVNNEAYAILQSIADDLDESMLIDHNLYYQNGWRPYDQGGVYKGGAMAILRKVGGHSFYPTLGEVQARTPWEAHGVAGDPILSDYDPGDHDLHDGSWPDFRLTPASVHAIDRGTTALPASLITLLAAFGVPDPRWGTALDIGRYELGFSVLPSPPVQAIEPGGCAQFTLRLYPSGLPDLVRLTVQSPSPDLAVAVDPETIRGDTTATLTASHRDSSPGPAPGTWYLIPITGHAGDLAQTTYARLLVGGSQIYLPVLSRSAQW